MSIKAKISFLAASASVLLIFFVAIVVVINGLHISFSSVHLVFAEAVPNGGEAEPPAVVPLHAVISGGGAAELLVVVGYAAYHTALEVERHTFPAGEFEGFEDEQCAGTGDMFLLFVFFYTKRQEIGNILSMSVHYIFSMVMKSISLRASTNLVALLSLGLIETIKVCIGVFVAAVAIG